MKVWFTLLCALLCSGTSNAPQFRAKVISVSMQQCQRAGSYELQLGGTALEVQNSSDHTLLIPRKIEVVSAVSAAITLDDAKRGNYTFAMDQHFGGTLKNLPQLEDFIALGPRAIGRVEIDSLVLPVTLQPQASGDSLRPGTYWAQLTIGTLPTSLFFSSKNLAQARKKFKSAGTLVHQYLDTEPFHLEVTVDPAAPACD
jgi:hypothetical protein